MRKTALTLCLIFLAAAHGTARAAEEVDRLVAAVNGRIITEADLKLAANLNALLLFGQSSSQPRDREVRRLDRPGTPPPGTGEFPDSAGG